MSLLTDLLSKIKYKRYKVDVPPSLISDVEASKAARKRRIVVLSILLLLLVGSGIGVVVFLEYYLKPEPVFTKRHIPQPPAQQPKDTGLPLVEPGPQTGLPPKQPHTKAPTKGTKRPTPELKIPSEEPQLSQQKEVITEEEVIQDKQTAVQEQPKVVDTLKRDQYIYAAMSFETRRQMQEALNMYKKALEIDPENYIIQNNISGLLLKVNEPQEAMMYAKMALQRRDKYTPAMINLAIALIKMREHAQAEEILLRVLNAEPANSAALYNIAVLYERNGELLKASTYYSRLAEIGNIQGRLGIGRIAEREGRREEALRVYQEVLASGELDSNTKAHVNERITYLKTHR